jgi:hypothetical protein
LSLAHPTMPPTQAVERQLQPIARMPGMRALAWSESALYASRKYDLVRTTVQNPAQPLIWETLGKFHPGWKRSFSVSSRLSSRLFRDGFHSLAVVPNGFVAAVPGAIIALSCNESEFRVTHKITRGTRPLHVTATPEGSVFWGEYFDNASRDEVHIYGSFDGGATWNVVHTFPKGAIRHVHNIVHDPWQGCLWVLTGDNGGECRVLRASCDFSQVEIILHGNQQARAVAAVPTESGLYFASDTPLESNFIYRLDPNGNLSKLAGISSSSIYGCRVAEHLFFSTMVEPSEVNRDRSVRVYSGVLNRGKEWQSQLSWTKDSWPMRLFQYGNAIFPDGNNATSCLALTTVAVQKDDMVTALYQVRS